MFQTKPWIEQTDPPRSPRETLPTMYDLPSEDPQEPGCRSEFHDLQPQLLTLTCRSRRCSPQQMFAGTDINLYYNVRHPLWHKRPDWFVAVGVPRLYDEVDLRLSYVIWQEGVSPLVVVEFLSPGTAKEDLGANVKAAAADEGLSSAKQSGASTPLEGENGKSTGDENVKETPPRKWEVYEQILRVPYYVVFSPSGSQSPTEGNPPKSAVSSLHQPSQVLPVGRRALSGTGAKFRAAQDMDS